MRKSFGIIIIIFISLLWLQCSDSDNPAGTIEPVPHRTIADLTSAELNLLGSCNRFGLKLFSEVARDVSPDSNIFISPLSVSYALGMAYNGASGETRDSIAATLEMAGLSVEEINQSYQSLNQLLTQLDPEVAFNIANSIWYALVRQLDFDQPWAADTINHWVDVNTNGKIDKVISNPIDPSVLVYLINAIYFKGAWTYPFDPDSTYQTNFYPSDGVAIECDMMSRNDTIMFYSNDYFQAVNLPYSQGDFSMTLLVPKPSITMEELISSLTAENWANWTDSFMINYVTLGLPKFKFEYETGMNDMLKSMGMNIAFGPYADFTNMLAGGGYIDTVIHKSFVQVDEEGTEAAAVTVIAICGSALPGMILDRPFLFVIHENETGTILFIGKIARPIWAD